MAPVLALAVGLLSPSCERPTQEMTVVVSARPGVDLGEATWSPASAVRRAVRSETGWSLTIDVGTPPPAIEIRSPGACPARVGLSDVQRGEVRRAELVPWIDLGEDRAQVGFDTPFEIEVKPGCREAVAGRITWRVVEGRALPETREEKNGFRLRARTPKLEEARSGDVPWGIVPLSPSTRGAVTLEATWKGVGPTVTRTLHVAAAARAGGIPSIAVGQRVLLGGSGWRVTERPPGGKAEVSSAGGHPAFLPDTGGRWVLEDGSGATLSLRAGRHVETPLDCGRAECHASAAEGAATTRMTTILHDGLRGMKGPSYDLACTMPCHTVGEPGLHDGGFADVARELGAVLPGKPPQPWEALPRPLRRLGGVGCTACHGPGAIPERAARWTILRSDVCATCHDAPPRYGHVAAWRSSRMARADAAPETRASARCRQCHTTAGFLDAIGVRPASMSDGGPDEPRGIGCAACHAPHAPDPLPSLVRRTAPPPSLGSGTAGTSSVCLRCHAPLADDRTPSASAAALWLGRLTKDGPETLGPHSKVEGACVGCHVVAVAGAVTERGAGHTFRVDRARCAPCHVGDPQEVPGKGGLSVSQRAALLWKRLLDEKLVVTARDTAPHAAMELRAGPGSPEERAAAKVLAVLEDRGAGAHNGPFARQLLDEAEALLDKAGR